MPKIMIGTPMYGGACSSQFLMSMLDLQVSLLGAKHQFQMSVIVNESLISRARNSIADAFMKSNCDYLLFIDSDHGFVAEDVLKMIEEDVDILSAIAPKKTINWNSVKTAMDLNLENPQFYTGDFVINAGAKPLEIDITKPFEINNGGTGMMLIRRNVMEQLSNVLPSYIPNNSIEEVMSDNRVTEFFATEIDNDILLSEDYYFCKKWRELGGKVYAAPWVRISHVGTYEFTGSFLASLDLQNMQSS